MKKIKNKKIISFVLVLILILFSYTLCHADKGIFHPKVNPNEIFTSDIPVTIDVLAEIGDLPMNDVKVMIYQTSKDGAKLNSLCEMKLDIPRGLFAGHFNLNQNYESVFYFKIVADYNSQDTFESPILNVAIYEPLPEGIAEDTTKALKTLENNFLTYLKSNSLSIARQMALEDAKKNPNITSAFLNGRNLSIVYKNKVNGVASLDDPNGEPVDSW